MMKTLLFISLILLISYENLHCQYWQEQIVLQGNVITQCFDENDDVLFSSTMSNKKYAVCKYSIEKDSIDKVLLVINNPVNLIEVLSDGTIMAFQDYQLLRSTDKGESWEGISNKFKFPNIWINYDLKEYNSSLILWEEKNHYISFDKGTSWRVLRYQDTNLIHIEPTFNEYLVAVEPKYKSPVFSSNYGLTWEKTNLDTVDLIGFIYSEISQTLYALTWPREKYFFKSTDGGKYWEKVIIAIDTVINSYDIDSQGNLFIMDAKNDLYKYIPENRDLQLISLGAPFSATALLPYFGKRYRHGIFLDNIDNIYYYDALGFKFWNFDKENKKWMDSVNVIHNDVHPYSFVRKGLTFSNRADKWLVNAESSGFEFIDLAQIKLKSQSLPAGIEPLTEYYDLSPNGELAFANYYNQYYDYMNDTIESVIARYSISKDSGFSRKWLLSDTNNLYNQKNENYLVAENNYSTLAFNSESNLFIVGNQKTCNIDLFTNTIEMKFNTNLGYFSPKIIGASPDGYLYVFCPWLYSQENEIITVKYKTSVFFRSNDNGKTWDLLDSNAFGGNFNVLNIQFLNDGTIFVSTKNINWPPFYSSSDNGSTWKSHGYQQSMSVYSLYTDNKDNMYYNHSNEEGWYRLSYKNWVSWGDTCDVVATKCGDIFATIGNYDITKHIYSSDYGDSWIDYPPSYILNPYHPIKSNDKGDVYQGKDNYSDGNTLYVLYKFIREQNPMPHPLSDTTVYTMIVDVEENKETQKNEIFIYPNPASEYIEINVGERHAVPVQNDIKIYNTFGQCVLKSFLPSPFGEGQGVRLDVSHLPVGMYFVRIGNQTKKFVKY